MTPFRGQSPPPIQLGQWDEQKHPRAADGKFGSGSGDFGGEDAPVSEEFTRPGETDPLASKPSPAALRARKEPRTRKPSSWRMKSLQTFPCRRNKQWR